MALETSHTQAITNKSHMKFVHPRLIRGMPGVRHEGSFRSVAYGVDKPDEAPGAHSTKLNREHAHGQVVSRATQTPKRRISASATLKRRVES